MFTGREVGAEPPKPEVKPEQEEKLNSPAVFAEAREFCRKRDQVPGRIASPAKCQMYYACWANLYDKAGNKRPLEKVVHFKFKCDKTPDLAGYETFDNTEQKCVLPKEGKVCRLDGTWGTWIPTLSMAPNHVIPSHPTAPEVIVAPEVTSQGEEIVQPNDLATKFCKGKGNEDDGNYPHPSDPPKASACLRFIQCWFGQNLFKEMNCPSCPRASMTCPHGRLFFNASSGDCETTPNPEVCITPPLSPRLSPRTKNNKNANKTTKLKVPPTDKSVVRPSPGQNSTELPPPTDSNSPIKVATLNEPTPFPPPRADEKDLTTLPADNYEEPVDKSHLILSTAKKCSPKRYVQHGYCKHFFSCDRKKRMEKKRTCSGRLYWNPDAQTMHGGRCDFLRNLGNFTLREYQKDSTCPLHIVYFRADDEQGKTCSPHYFFHHPKRTEGTEVRLSCPDDLLWSKEMKTCVLCNELVKKDGVTPCCGNGKEVEQKNALNEGSLSF